MYDYKCMTALVSENTFDSRPVFVLLSFVGSRLVEVVSGHPWPSVSGTGVPCGCPCRDRPVCLCGKAPSHFVVVGVVGVVTSCVLCARVARVSKDLKPTGCRSFATENTYTPARLEALFKLSVVTTQSFVPFPIFAPKFRRVVGVLSNSSSCARSHRTFLACCL